MAPLAQAITKDLDRLHLWALARRARGFLQVLLNDMVQPEHIHALVIGEEARRVVV